MSNDSGPNVYIMPGGMACAKCGYVMFCSKYLHPGKALVWCEKYNCENRDKKFIAPIEARLLDEADLDRVVEHAKA